MNMRCPGCGAFVPDVEESRTRNRYVGAAPGCFAAYAELIGREQSDPALAESHMLAADAYPAQHPGVPGRQSSQSIWVHLVGLCLTLEHGFDGLASARAKAGLATPDAIFDWLEPPVSLGRLTVLDAMEAIDPAAHEAVVRRWAEGVWSAWAQHHTAIRLRAAQLMAGGTYGHSAAGPPGGRRR